jgi:hypothetical protein
MAAEHTAIGEVPQPQGDDLRLALCRISETYGRAVCRHPQRVAAMLRDLCPGARRESFLLVAALREGVVSDLVAGLDSVPDDLLLARGAGKLREHLGLSEDSARWSVESWLPACRVLATAPDRPLRFDGGESSPEEEPAPLPEVPLLVNRRVDWPWLGLCAASMVCAAVAVCTVARSAFFHYWSNFGGWVVQTGVLVSGLAVAGFGMALIARAIARRRAPNQRSLDPNRAAGAMTIEVLTLLTLPLVPVLSTAIWAAEWIGELHVSGQPHHLEFQFGRILQTLILAVFLYKWMPLMTAIQGKIASSMVRSR